LATVQLKTHYHRRFMRERQLSVGPMISTRHAACFFPWVWFIPLMTPRLILALAVAFAFVGCGKRPETASPIPASTKDSSQTAAGAPAAEQTPASAPRSDTSGTDLAATLGNLTQALRKYSFEHQRLPKTFTEVVAAGYVKDLPPAPAGKKFEIDAKTVQVILVKQ
jgi:hypothetical protein